MSRLPFCGSLPTDLLYDTRYDMWVRRDGEQVTIGATGFGIHLAGEIIAFTAKPRGAIVEQGRGLGTVECAKTVLAVHAPLSFHLDAANEAAEENPALINHAPYGKGWMARGTPLHWDAESTCLVDAAAYAVHIRSLEPDARIDP